MENPYGAASAPAEPQKEAGPQLLRGAIAGLVAGAVTAAGWYYLTLATDAEFGIAAWGLGIAIGFATLWGAKQSGTVPGIMAAVIALAAIVGGKYMVGREIQRQAAVKIIDGFYEVSLTVAKKVCAAQTDDEKRLVLAGLNGEDGEDLKPEAVAQEEVDSFDTKVRPTYEPLATGKVTREQWTGEKVDMIMKDVPSPLFADTKDSLFMALWLFLGVGSAWRIATGASKS